jgi:hypothetical protein
VQRLTALAWVAHAEGNNDVALRWMRSAAELSGDRKRASDRYSELLQLCGEGEASRLELQNARAFLQAR